MITAEVVVETLVLPDFTAWPIAERPDDLLLALSGQMSLDQVGTVMAELFSRSGIPVEPLSELHHLLDRHLVEAECLTMSGGLRLHDTTTRAQIVPGCCCGLEDWRDWAQLLQGDDELWLGHDPHTRVRIEQNKVRLDQNARALNPAFPSSVLEISLNELPDLLKAAHRQLQGFLDSVDRWAGALSPQAASRLVQIFDENFQISDPLLLD
ncbi:hypothetical protein [Actinomadura hibisca]|uniref:hypothetical protein n=1 Tax=Actinomadura hibisca TaxID=68565 RepID=UPI000835DC9B|nr:hypothetical protein [Actinomadura hibisca]